MRRENSVATPALYDGIAATPGPLHRRPELQRQQRSTTPRAWRQNLAAQAGNDDHDSAFWKQRNLIPGADGLERAAVPHPGPDREQHGRRRPAAVPAQPHRLRARLARPVGARARQRDRRPTGTAEDGPRRLVRRGHALLRPLPQGHHADGRATRRSPCRPTTASGARRPQWPPADSTGYTTALRAGSYTDTTALDGAGRPTRRPASGRSPSRCPTTCTCPGSGTSSST